MARHLTKPRKTRRKSTRSPPRLPAKLQANSKLQATMELEGSLELEATSEEGVEPKLTLHANTGKPMDIAGFPHPVIVDMKGVAYDKRRTPIIADHKTTNRVGHTVQQIILTAGQRGKLNGKDIVGPFIGAVGVRSSEMEIAKGIIKDAKAGFPFQVSIGATIKKGYILDEGETADINGKMWKGPLVVAQKAVIRELSITALGADNDTTTIVASKPEENDMDFEAWVESLGLVLADQSDETVKKLKAQHAKLNLTADDSDDEPPAPRKGKGKKKKIKATVPDDDDAEGDLNANNDADDLIARQSDLLASNSERVEGIGEIYAEFSDSVEEVEYQAGGKTRKVDFKTFKAHAIRSGMTVETFELHARRASLPSLATPAIQMVDKNLDAKALECAILRSNGLVDNGTNAVTKREYGLDAWYDEKTLTASWDRKYQINNSIGRLLAMQVHAAGGYAGHLHDSDLIAAARESWGKIKAYSGASGLSITNILENVMHKATLASFEQVESVWRQFTGVMSVNDFRVHNLYRLDMNGQFRKVPTDGELKHIGMSDSKYTISADTYGAMIAVDRKTRIDDDLSMVVSKARGMGTLAGLRIEELVFVTLLSNPSSFFAAGNGNLQTGGGSALSLSSLEVATTAFANQVINYKPIAVAPTMLLVGTNQQILAGRLFREERMGATGDTDAIVFTDNPFAGRFRPIVSGYLNNTAIKDQDGNAISGQSTTQWYLFTPPMSPQGNAIVVAFLNGRQTPFIDEAETQFNIPGGIQMRAYFDFGCAMHITQLAYKSAGA